MTSFWNWEWMYLDQNNERYRLGTLPELAPLAGAYVPMQQSVEPGYVPDRALARGTLFPGLDLPFMGIVAPDMEQTPRNELMAICFVVDELELYLDTHAEDREAFALYQSLLDLLQEARERYVRSCGPLIQSDQRGMDRYVWLDDPWPWELKGQKEG